MFEVRKNCEKRN